MEQLHRRISDEQIKLIIRNYSEGKLTRKEVQETLGVGKSHFFNLLKEYRKDSALSRSTITAEPRTRLLRR